MAFALCLGALLMASPSGHAGNPGEDWEALLAGAFAEAEVVLTGTVESVDNQTPVGGGHIYGVSTTRQYKGDPVDSVSVRAGGFAYLVRLDSGETVLMFLKPGPAGDSGGHRAVVEAEPLRPMVFRVSGNDVAPVNPGLYEAFAGVSAQDLAGRLRALSAN